MRQRRDCAGGLKLDLPPPSGGEQYGRGGYALHGGTHGGDAMRLKIAYRTLTGRTFPSWRWKNSLPKRYIIMLVEWWPFDKQRADKDTIPTRLKLLEFQAESSPYTTLAELAIL